MGINKITKIEGRRTEDKKTNTFEMDIYNPESVVKTLEAMSSFGGLITKISRQLTQTELEDCWKKEIAEDKTILGLAEWLKQK